LPLPTSSSLELSEIQLKIAIKTVKFDFASRDASAVVQLHYFAQAPPDSLRACRCREAANSAANDLEIETINQCTSYLVRVASELVNWY
jgi:hypothetical protein